MERLPNCPETCRLIRHLVIKLAPVILGEKPAGLLRLVAETLSESVAAVRLMVPYAAGHIAGAVRAEGNVSAEEYTPDGVLLTATVPRRSLHKYQAYLVDAAGKAYPD